MTDLLHSHDLTHLEAETQHAVSTHRLPQSPRCQLFLSQRVVEALRAKTMAPSVEYPKISSAQARAAVWCHGLLGSFVPTPSKVTDRLIPDFEPPEHLKKHLHRSASLGLGRGPISRREGSIQPIPASIQDFDLCSNIKGSGTTVKGARVVDRILMGRVRAELNHLNHLLGWIYDRL